jgi:NAD(P)-dependent dehydrogenase (short-subunit alcohol dehydrogenase family)
LIRENGGTGRFVVTDVTDETDVETFIETAVSEFGGFDITFNPAGISNTRVPFEEKCESDWHRIFELNITSLFRCLKHELAMMKSAGTGTVMNNASVMGKVATQNTAAYVAAKYGIVGLTKGAALDAAGDGVIVNAVCPEFIEARIDAEVDDEWDEDRPPTSRQDI